MRPLRSSAWLGLLASLAAAASGAERNAWPVWVGQTTTPVGQENAAATVQSWTSAGPFLFAQPLLPDPFAKTNPPVRVSGFRPFYVQKTDAAGHVTEAFVLPPLFRYRADSLGNRWSVFSLINRESPDGTRERGERNAFEIWPFYLSRQTGNPTTSYRAVFPLYGSITQRFGQDRWTWALFPLYGRFEKNGVTTTTTPWPIIKVLRGQENRGFEVWPLFGYRAKPGAYREQFYLWPLIYRTESKLWETKPDVKSGFLPFFARTSDANSRSETYLWPFFGYYDRTAPTRYHETRYFWPLLVQGRGDDRIVNRWAPFYTRSAGKGVEKTWLLWPFWRQVVSDEGALIQTKRQLLYFLYNSTEQRSSTNPVLPAARKTHVWPLFTLWDNGAGRRQLQALNPLEVFFPHNETMRITYTPLFGLYRYDRASLDTASHSLLWNFVTLRREPSSKEFHLGPLFSAETQPRAKRYTLFSGLAGWEKRPTGGWRVFAFQFKHRAFAPAVSRPSRPAALP